MKESKYGEFYIFYIWCCVKKMFRDLPVLNYPVNIGKLRSYMHPKKHDDQISCFLTTISCVYCLCMKKLGPIKIKCEHQLN